MLSKEMQSALNEQIKAEAESSQLYLKMACWAEAKGYRGIAKYFFKGSEEERAHMLKMIHYVLDRGGKVVTDDFENPTKIFEKSLHHEKMITDKLSKLSKKAFESDDYLTHEFLQWYLHEQIEEEDKVMAYLDKLKMIGNDGTGIYLFDNELDS